MIPRSKKVRRARQLRRASTPAETRLWWRLRAGQRGCRIRRQHLIVGYIVDFYAARAGLVIEVDGSVHQRPDVRANDEFRERVLRANGYRVLRVANADVMLHLDQVLRSVDEQLAFPRGPVRRKRIWLDRGDAGAITGANSGTGESPPRSRG